MKFNTPIHKPLAPVLVGLALASTVSLSQAQGVDDYIVQRFTNDVGSWALNYGNTLTNDLVWDGTENRNKGDGTGSMKVTIGFDLCSGQIQRDFEGLFGETLDLTKYTALHFSVKVDPSSSRLGGWGNGAFGNMRMHIRKSDWSGDGNFTNPAEQWVGTDAYGTWVDYTLPIDPGANAGTQPVAGILGVDVWSGWGDCTDFPTNAIGHTNTVIFWMDNIWFEINTNLAPPTVSLGDPGPDGVQITLSEPGNQWQRDALVTPDGAGSLFWSSGGGSPVSYSFTISEFPEPDPYEGFQAHMFIVNQDTDTNPGFNSTYGGCDWNVPDILRLQLTSTTNGTYDASVNWKTNLPNANPLTNAIYNPVDLTNLSTIVGTWTLTFDQLTNGNLSGPGGVSTNFTIPQDAVFNNFSPSLGYIQFGFHKNDNENDGHNDGARGVFSRVQSAGGDFVFDDTFDGASLTNNYAWRRTSADAVQFIPQDTALALNWTLPAPGFVPESAVDAAGPWGDAGASDVFTGSGQATALIPSSSLPSEESGLFRLIKRVATKLQILLPGESPAPGTPSGKTGTPTPVNQFDPVSLTVRMVDDDWNLVPGSSPTVTFSSTDGLAFLPSDAPLTNGVGVFEMFFDTPGSQTVTVSNVTDPSILPDTSSSITVN